MCCCKTTSFMFKLSHMNVVGYKAIASLPQSYLIGTISSYQWTGFSSDLIFIHRLHNFLQYEFLLLLHCIASGYSLISMRVSRRYFRFPMALLPSLLSFGSKVVMRSISTSWMPKFILLIQAHRTKLVGTTGIKLISMYYTGILQLSDHSTQCPVLMTTDTATPLMFSFEVRLIAYLCLGFF